jgi:predicted nucleic acid-binding protein
MILVADCSALVALASCDALHLLDALFGTVVVPEAVYREAVVGDRPQARRLEAYLKGKIRSVDPDHPVLLDGFSDLGETEAMMLYLQLSADKLLIDDKRGRRVAKVNRMNIIGSLGVLLGAKRANHIEAIAPYISELASSDVYLSTDLLAMVMEIAGEAWPVSG